MHLVLTLGGGGGCPGNMSLQLHQHFPLGPGEQPLPLRAPTLAQSLGHCVPVLSLCPSHTNPFLISEAIKWG